MGRGCLQSPAGHTAAQLGDQRHAQAIHTLAPPVGPHAGSRTQLLELTLTLSTALGLVGLRAGYWRLALLRAEWRCASLLT